MPSITTQVRHSPPRRPAWHGATTVISLTALASLLFACAPGAPAPAAPPSAPAAAPAPAANPAAQPATAPPAAPAAPAKPAAAPPEPSGSVTLVMPEEPPTLDPGSATGTVAYPVIRNVEEAL